MTREARRFAGGCVASPHHLASSAGLAVLASGGNALDAAIAVNLTLGVVAPYTCGFGGDLFAIVWDGTALHAYNGSGRAPALATPEAAGRAARTAQMPTYGPHAVSVPGAVEAWFTLLERFGTRSFEELAQWPLRYADEGFPLTRRGADTMRGAAVRYRGPEHEEWNRIYRAARAGARFVQSDLARTIRVLTERGPKAFYDGEIGEAVAAHLQRRGALMRADDLAAHHGDFVGTISTTFRGLEVHEMPPNTQGVTALEALNIADGLDLGEPESADRHHLLIEACKLALADREEHVSDPASMRVPPERLASREWADARRELVDPRLAHVGAPAPGADGGTAYMCATDASGMCVSLIQSNFAGFGSGVTVPGWGINLQNRASSFTFDEGHVNAIAPRKRPMHTLIPAMGMRDGRPWLVFGTMGGHGQAQTHVQLLTRVLVDGLDVQDAIDRPRWMVSPADWGLRAEEDLGDELLDELTARGHHVTRVASRSSVAGHAHAIRVEEGGYAGATDPRAEGAVLGL